MKVLPPRARGPKKSKWVSTVTAHEALELIDVYNKLKKLVDDCENDVYQNARGSRLAGTNLRRTLRVVRDIVYKLTRTTMEYDRHRRVLVKREQKQE